MYPVKGPLVEQRPVPVVLATVDGILGNTGGFYLTLPNGDECRGRWSSIAPMSVTYSSGTASGTASDGWSTVWSTVYGSGYTVRNKPGVNRGEAMAICSKGGNVQAEFLTGSGTANGTGVAKDSYGNFYKLIF
ncbi:hypothetical protein LJR175_000824 [Variovorax sp. LjRoot175]|uniref:hypothetical protein n=1 Tax=Variovorax sp. LjRoot175 TaxID=3342276 RepID=UPI003ECC5AD1